MELSCSPSLLATLVDAARHSNPREACGLVLGRPFGEGFEATELRELANRAAEPDHAFELDPLEFLEAEAEARAAGLVLLGLFHSHPRGDTHPSHRDLSRDWPTPTCWIADPQGEVSIWRRAPDGRPVRLQPRLVPS